MGDDGALTLDRVDSLADAGDLADLASLLQDLQQFGLLDEFAFVLELRGRRGPVCGLLLDAAHEALWHGTDPGEALRCFAIDVQLRDSAGAGMVPLAAPAAGAAPDDNRKDNGMLLTSDSSADAGTTAAETHEFAAR